MAHREVIFPKNDKLNVSRNFNLPHSPGIRAGDFIFLSGMLSTDPATGERSPGSMAHETRQTLTNMRHLLESAGSSLERVVKINVLLYDMLELENMNRVYPEFFLTPFFPNRLTHDFDRYFIALPDKGADPVFQAAADHRIALLFPYGEKDGRHYYNSCLVIDKTGKQLGVYRKTHIPAILPSNLPGGTGSYEKFYFSPGNEFPVFSLCGTKIGIQICYDRKYPEGSRLLALKGAEIIFMPICAATYGETKLRGNTWELPLQARAYENGVYVVAVNRAGNEHGRNHIGKSMIIDPVGAEVLALASSDGPDLLVATVDLDN